MAAGMHPDTATQAATLLWQHRQAGSKLAALPAALRPADAEVNAALEALR